MAVRPDFRQGARAFVAVRARFVQVWWQQGKSMLDWKWTAGLVLAVGMGAWCAALVGRIDPSIASPPQPMANATAAAGGGTASRAAGAMPAALAAAEGWTYLGPDKVGGPTSHIAVRPDGSGVVYAVSQLGAVFRSVDRGSHWQFLSQLPLEWAKLEITVDDPDTLYAYRPTYKDATYPLSGVFKSVDGGLTWQELQLPDNVPVPYWELYGVNDLKSLPGRPGVLFAATEDYGLLRSADGGASWMPVLDENGEEFWDCSELDIAPARSTVYAVCNLRPIAARADGLGARRLSSSNMAYENRHLKLAVSKANQDVVYMTTTRYEEGHSRLITSIWRSSNGGGSWDQRFGRSGATNPFNIALPGDFEEACGPWGPSDPGFGGYFEDYSIAVDPTNSDHLWIAGIEIYRSSDGGRTFGRAGKMEDFARNALVFDAGYNGTTNQTLYGAGVHGIVRTTNARAAVQAYPTTTCTTPGPDPAVAWATLHEGYSVARLAHGSVHDDFALVASGPGLGTLVGTAGDPDWATASWLVGQTLVDWSAGFDRLYVSQARDIGKLEWAGDRWLTGVSTLPNAWADGYFPNGRHYIPGEIEFVRFAQDPRTANRLVAAGYDGLYESRDAGWSWQRIGPEHLLVSVGFRRDGRLLASTSDGHVLAQEPGGGWSLRDLSGCELVEGHACEGATATFEEFFTSPDPASATMYAVARGGGVPKVFASSDARSWQALDRPGEAGGLPDNWGSHALAIDPHNPRHLYAGTPVGLYRSLDGGQQWSAMETPFGGTAVSRLVFGEDALGNRRLFAFTYGRGAWVLAVPPATRFVDVPAWHWAHASIETLYSQGITGGCSVEPLRYCPERAVTRDQMAVFLLRARHGGAYQPPAAASSFADVPAGHWASAWIERLNAEGITGGCSSSPRLYCPAAGVTRAQMAVFLLRATHGATYQPPPATGLFADVPGQYWAAAWIEQLAREGIAGGCSATPKNFCPEQPVTRAQMAAFLVRAF